MSGSDPRHASGATGPLSAASSGCASLYDIGITGILVSVTASAEADEYVVKRRTLVIHHSSDDRIVALIEIASPGNKSSRHAIKSFVEKAVEALYVGYHLLIVDLFPPGPRDPQGLHGAIWSMISDEPFELPPGRPLTLASYSSGPSKRAYVEPTAIDRKLIDMPECHQLKPQGFCFPVACGVVRAAWS